MQSKSHNDDLSRRQFMGTLTGAAAIALIFSERRALADSYPGQEITTDYNGRLCYNENPLGPSPAAIQAIIEQAPMAHRYSDWYAESLVSSLAGYHQVSTNQITCGCGATEILRLCAMAFTVPGRNVVAPYPSYTQFMGDAELFGATVRYSDLDSNYVVDLAAARSLVNSSTTCICMTNPNNPTGTFLNSQSLIDFVDSLPSGVLTIIDEAYFEYIDNPQVSSAINMVRQGKDVVVVKTFSKVHGLAGARIGYAVGPAARISQIRAKHISATVSRLSLEAARAALGDSQHVADSVVHARNARNYCLRQFEEAGIPSIDSTTSFFMVDVGEGDYVRAQLANRGIYVRTGWGMNSFIRVSCGTMAEMRDFVTALKEIVRALRNGHGGDFVPQTVDLFQASPNPFNGSTDITILLPRTQKAKLEIFDIQGRLVKRLVDSQLGAGRHRFTWHGDSQSGNRAASGLYYYRLTAADDTITRRLLLLR